MPSFLIVTVLNIALFNFFQKRRRNRIVIKEYNYIYEKKNVRARRREKKRKKKKIGITQNMLFKSSNFTINLLMCNDGVAKDSFVNDIMIIYIWVYDYN
jgi:hypothetical protein